MAGRQYSEWYVSYKGRRLALLSDGKFEDMFWVSYKLTPLTEDPRDIALLASKEFWDSCEQVYHNRESGAENTRAFSSMQGPQGGRITMRALL